MKDNSERHAAPLLLIGFGSEMVIDLIPPLVAAGYAVKVGTPADLASGQWWLVISAPVIPGLGGMELLAALRAPGLVSPPRLLVVGTARQLASAGAAADAMGAQWLTWPFEPQDIVQCVQAMLSYPPPRLAPSLEPVAPPPEPLLALLNEDRFLELVTEERDEQRAGRSPGESFVVALRLDEFERYRERLAPGSQEGLWRQVAELVELDALADQKVAQGESGDLLLLLPSSSRRQAARQLQALSSRLATHSFELQGQTLRFSPVIGYSSVRRSAGAAEALGHAREALSQAGLHLDLQPTLYRSRPTAKPGSGRPAREPSVLTAFLGRLRQKNALMIQYAFTMVLGLVIPFLVYWGLGSVGFDISSGVYIFVVVFLVLTSLLIWAEGFLALKRVDPPGEPATPYPPASAIIAAYLPNEAPIIEDTIRAFLRVQYPGHLQIILAYNTPHCMPEIEERLMQIAREHPRFVPMRVRKSTSKAQNVNAALPYATGEFTAVFDADHEPDPDSFRRAWRWLSHGADVVQGHCFIRNGAASWVARMVAVEFEQIYSVNHPGRVRLHGFGIFGGSNGYWRSGLLRELRMHGFMLTEDIDSSMRAVVHGRRIVSDPYLVSRELAPETLSALTKQRLRWAQGWFQVSMKWIIPALRSRSLSVRQKLGMMHLLAWREAYPWVSMQILPLIAYWAVEAGSLSRINWFMPLFVVATLFTLSTGPGQILFIYKLADPQIKKHTSWFWFFVVVSILFYAGLKNAWARIAHLKEALGETAWVVTTRTKT